MKKIKFLRRGWTKHSRLGKNRKKKQVWRRPKGRHSKTRERERGYPPIVRIGYKQEKREKNFVVNNVKELEKATKDMEISIGKVGKRKKLEIAKKAKEKGIKIHNLNIKKFLKKAEKKAKKETKEEKKK